MGRNASDDCETGAPKHRGGIIALAKIRARAKSTASSMPAVAASAAAPSVGAGAHRRMRDTSAADETPPTKRLRRGAGPSPVSSAAGARAGAASSASSSVGEPVNLEVGSQCFACGRAYHVDCSWQTPTQDFQWLYSSGKGSLCRDCGNLHRVAFKSMPLNIFERWLNQAADHRISYFKLLVSYLSLQYEGNRHITLQTLKGREQMLTWVFDLVQSPFPVAEVTECDASFLDSMLNSQVPGRYLAGTPNGGVVGLQPRVPPAPSAPKSSRRFVLHSQARRVWPLLAWSSLPSDFEASWRDRLAAHAFAGAASAIGDDFDHQAEAESTMPIVNEDLPPLPRSHNRVPLGLAQSPRRIRCGRHLDDDDEEHEGERFHRLGEEDHPVEGGFAPSVLH